MHIKTIRIFTFIFTLIGLNCFSITNDICSEASMVNNAPILTETSSVNITIEIYEDTAEIIVPEDDQIRILRGYSIPVRISLDYKTESTNLGDFRLAIRSPGTTLVPVKIPPPPPPSTRNNSRNESRAAFLWQTIYIDGQRLSVGNHTLRFALEKCNGGEECYSTDDLPPENLIDTNSVRFEVYPNSDLSFANFYWIPNPGSNGFILKYIIQNYHQDPIDQSFKMKFYVSNDNELGYDDKLFHTKNISGIGPYVEKDIDLIIDGDLHKRLMNKYVICKLDADNEVSELREDNNITGYFVTPYKDLKIRDIEISYPRGADGIYINCIISNEGELDIQSTSVTSLYYNNPSIRPRLLDSQKLPPVGTNEYEFIQFHIKDNDYNISLAGSSLRIFADDGNNIIETNEKNNEIKFNLPHIVRGQTIKVYSSSSIVNKSNMVIDKKEAFSPSSTISQKTYPNPFVDSVTFSFNIVKEKSSVFLSIYDAKGVIVDELTTKEYTSGKQTLIYNNTDLSQGVFFYKLQIDDKFYNGSIIKNK